MTSSVTCGKIVFMFTWNCEFAWKSKFHVVVFTCWGTNYNVLLAIVVDFGTAMVMSYCLWEEAVWANGSLGRFWFCELVKLGFVWVVLVYRYETSFNLIKIFSFAIFGLSSYLPYLRGILREEIEVSLGCLVIFVSKLIEKISLGCCPSLSYTCWLDNCGLKIILWDLVTVSFPLMGKPLFR